MVRVLRDLVFVAVVVFGQGVYGRDYYVCPGGDDGSDGNKGGAFKTIGRAGQVMRAGDVCYVGKGVYRESVVPGSSGEAGKYVSFVAESDGVVLNLTRQIVGWEVHSKNIYKAKVSWGFERLFVDGKWMPVARYPNGTVDPMYPVCKVATGDSGDSGSIIDEGLDQIDGYWAGAMVWVTPGDEWVIHRTKIKEFEKETHKLGFEAYSSKGHYRIKKGNRYYIYNKFEELDSPGEWYLDVASNTVYLWMPGGDNPNDHLIEVSDPEKKSVGFRLDGLSYVKVRGFEVFDGTISLGESRYCVVEDCKVSWGDRELCITGEYNKVVGCDVSYVPEYGVRVGGSHNLLDGCEVHHSSYYVCGHSLVDVSGEYNTVSGCKVHHGGKDGITWDRANKGGGHCLITRNEVYEPTTICSDCGCFYTWGRDGNGTVVSYNKFHDNNPPGTIGWGGSGLYLDNNSRNFICYRNVCYNNSAIGIQLNLPSVNNKIYNNVSYNNKFGFIVGPSRNPSMAGTEVKNNIFVNNNEHDCANLEIGKPEPRPVMENNCYYNGDSRGRISPDDVESSAVVGDPCFVDGEKYDFRLRSDSPCIDKGQVIKGVTDEYIGSGVDIGVYEFRKDAAVSGRRYFESFDNGCGGWLSDRGYRLNVWDGVAYCYSPWYLDCWHAPPGAGYLHLVMWIHTHADRLSEYYPGYPGNEFVKQKQSTDLTNAKLSVRLRGNMDMQGTQLLVLVQAIQAEGMRANYVLTAQPFEVTPQWSEQTVVLAPDEKQWVCMGARHDRKKYGPEYGCSSIAEVLRNVDVDIIFVLFPLNVVPVEDIADKDLLRPCVDYHVEQEFLPKGLIMFDSVKIEYPDSK